MKYLAVLLVSCVGKISLAQNASQAQRLDCIAHWKKGEEKTYLLTRNKAKLEAGKPGNSDDFLIETTVSVLDSSAEGYTLRWDYAIPRELEKNTLKYQVAAVYAEMQFVYKTDPRGVFTELVNWEEIRDFYVEMFKAQLRGKEDSMMKKIVDQTIEMFKTKEAVESGMIREIQLYHAPYGVPFSTNDTSVSGEIASPIIPEPVPAVASWKIGEIDEGGDIFKLIMAQNIDSLAALKVIESFLKKYDIGEKANAEEIRKAISSLKLDDHNEYRFVKSTGWLKGYYVKRIASSGASNQVETYKMELRE